jgi:hypothetical protein
MSNEFTPQNDYKLVEFTKNDKETIKRVRDYSIRNCRKKIETSYITDVLNNFDYGIAYFRTEILKKNNLVKNRPCVFACVKYQENNKLFLLLICSIQNNDNLGTKILNEIFSFAKNKGCAEIYLECNESNINFYKKFQFVENNKTDDEMISMTKYIN